VLAQQNPHFVLANYRTTITKAARSSNPQELRHLA
jgi:hypothetical protein